MKAGIYFGIQDVKLQEIEMPHAKKNDIVIRVAKAGICGTDIHAYLHGGDPVGIHAGNQFGHEFVGTVQECGENVKDIPKGMRVTINPTSRVPLGKGLNSTEIADMSGAFSEYVVVEEAKLGYNVFALPDSLSFDTAVLCEPLSVAAHGVARARLQGNEKALVYGAGTIGLATVTVLQSKGIKDIIIADVNEFRLQIAKKLGAIPFHSQKGNLVNFVSETFGRVTGNSNEDCMDVDVVIDCAGAPFIIGEFLDHAKTLSQLIVVAVHGQNIDFSPYWLLAKEVGVIGSRGYLPGDIEESIRILSDPQCRLSNIITHTFPHRELKKAFAETAEGKEVIKTVIDYN